MSLPRKVSNWLGRPIGRTTLAALGVWACLVPAWLFADALGHYRLHSDDFAYIAASRTWPRALANLFVPHNTHIVPAWRLVTWAVIAMAGRLANLQAALAMAAYAILAASMLLAGRLIARETGRPGLALAAMVVLGTTSVLDSAATWYSAGQTLWAAFGVLAMLWYLQGWRRSGGTIRLVLAALAAWAAGGFWTVGHVAGPVGAVYLWADGRSRCRKASAIPILATAASVALALTLGGRQINGKISFHGRTSSQAVDFVRGTLHTWQAVPEDLMLGNLGLVAETTSLQGALISSAVVGLWAASWVRGTWARAVLGLILVAIAASALVAGLVTSRSEPLTTDDLAALPLPILAVAVAIQIGPGLGKVAPGPSPLECAGGTLVLSSYLIEWSFRGYLPFSSLRGVVPWYDAIPQVGAILFAAGWWSRGRGASPLSRAGAIGIVALQGALVLAHQPRVDRLFVENVPRMSADEAAIYRTPDLQRLRALYLAEAFADWQRRHLARLDRAEEVARARGIGLEAIARAFGRVRAPEIPEVYDAAAMLALPGRDRENDPARVRRALAPFFEMEPEPTVPLPRVQPTGTTGPREGRP